MVDLDDAISEALNVGLHAPPADMHERVERHVARRTRARRVRIATTSVVAAIALTGTAAALAPCSHRGDLQVNHSGPNVTTAQAGGRTPGAPKPPAVEEPLVGQSGAAGQSAAGNSVAHQAPGAGPGTQHASGSNGTGSQSPAQPVTPPNPNAPVSELVVELHDDGVHLSATNVYDVVNLSFYDMRSNANQEVSLEGATSGATVQEQFPVGSTNQIHVTYVASSAAVPGGDASVNVSVRVLPASAEAEDTFTLDLHAGGWTLPNRALSTDNAPMMAGYDNRGGPWTSVEARTYKLVIENNDRITRTLLVPGVGRVFVGQAQKTVTVTMTLTDTADRTWSIEPVDRVYQKNGEGVILWIA